MPAAVIFATPVQADWIDYNGHLRDAYYGLIFSLATDALMERLGMDAAYRERTRCTLYTLETHAHYLLEVGRDDRVSVAAGILASDARRIHLAMALLCERRVTPAATAECMLLHVHQGEPAAAQPFPPQVSQAIERFQAETAGGTAGPGSRRIGFGNHG